MVSGDSMERKPLESGSTGQTSHLWVGLLNAVQLPQTAPSPDFISIVEQRWAQCTKLNLSLGSVLGLNQSPLPPARLRAASAVYSTLTFILQ